MPALRSGLQLGRLRCEHLTNPLGIDLAHPRLSWEAVGDRQGAVVRSSRVLVASSADRLAAKEADVWDSGWVAGAEAGQVFGGAALAPATRVHWTVAVEDDGGEVSAWAAPAWWESGLSADRWTADWVAAPFHAVPQIRTDVEVDAPIVSARLYVTALGIYRASINGRRVGDDWFRPGWTDYSRRVQVQTYDVTEYVEVGTNALGLVLADGWYAGRIGWLGDRRLYGPTPSVRAQLVVRHTDGSTSEYGTGPGWISRPGAILQTDFLTGERHDERLALVDWDRPGYAPPFIPGKSVVVVDPPAGVELVAPLAEPVRVTDVLDVVTLTEPSPSTYVLDLGQNIVGWARITVSGSRGDVVRLRFAEMLRPDGHLYTDNLRSAQATDEYTCGGDGEESWEPAFTFHGFRYIEVTGWPGGGPPPPGAVVGVVAHSDLERTGEVETSHPMVNQLLSNIDWGLRGNFLEVPTDCPQRDERLGWMGDIQVFAATACFTRDVNAFFTKWMWDVVDGQSEEGAFPDVAPRIIDLQDGAPAWGDAGVIVPWRAYEWYGDDRLVRTHYRSASAWVDYIAAANPDGRWINRRNGDIGDWLSVGSQTPKDVLSTAFFGHSADLAARLAAVAGDALAEARLREIADTVKQAFQAHYVDADGHVEGGTQSCYALALRFDLLQPELREAAGRHLAADVELHDFHPTVGFVGVPHLLPALSDTGHADVAYRILLQRSFPSWGHQIDCGATTMWERWDGWTPEAGFQTPGMNSFNHYAFGAVGEWIATRVAGIAPDPERPGFRNALLRPQPGDGLDWARGRFRSVRGVVECGWRRVDDGTIRYDVAVPVGATASLHLPAADGGVATDVELTSGRYSFTV